MIQPIYTSVSNADTVSCGRKGSIIKSDPIPLLRDNYLGEYRTELEKAKVRKNLGILDSQTLKWGDISGYIEKQEDLVNYVESKWNYNTELNQDIKNIQQAMDYALYFITNFKGESEAIETIQKEIQNINNLISNNESSISTLESDIININSSIKQLNEDLKSINVDANILAWIKAKLENSKTIKLVDDISLEVIISQQENNAIQILEDSGIYVRDFSKEIANNSGYILELQNNQQTIQTDLSQVKTDIIEVAKYNTKLPEESSVPEKIGGILEGTKVSELKGKTVTEILDFVLFPVYVRDLIYPKFYYNITNQLLEVGSQIVYPILTFEQNDSGTEIVTEGTEILKYNDIEVSEAFYSKLGTYTFTAIVNYNSGEYLVNNRGEVTNQRVEAGSLTATSTVVTTYPWYAGNSSHIDKQPLIPFGPSGDIEVSLSGEGSVIKIPGANSTLNLFQVDGGLGGFINVDLTGWKETIETINNYPYKVWTKTDSYNAILKHKLNFTLKE